MRGKNSHLLARWLCLSLTLGLAACSGGSDEATPPTTTTAAPAAPTTRPAPTIDLSQPIPGGSLHGTPRPPLENTGNDYVAIFNSLDATYRWLTENPDPAVITELYVPGTTDHEAGVQNFDYLAARGWRAADDGYRVLRVDLLTAQADLASLRVVDEFAAERIVDENGQQVGRARGHPGPRSWFVLLSRDAAGTWRIADWAPADEATVDL